MGAAGARTVAMLATVSLAAFVASGREPMPITSVGLSLHTIRCRGRSARAGRQR